MAETAARAPGPTGYVALVRSNHNYRSLWSGEIVSLFGDWFNLIASASLVSMLTGSGTAIGGLFVVRMLAPFLMSPIAGVAADRYNRKLLLIAADLSRAVIVLGFLLVRDRGDVWLLYALTALQLGISGFFIPARSALLPDIVSRRELGAANALSSATWSVMLAFGAAIGGLVAGQWGIYPAFLVDSASFLLSAMFLARIAYHIHPSLQDSDRSIRAGFQQYFDGLKYLRQHVDLLVISLHKAAIGLTANGVFQVIQVALAERVFVIGEGGGTSLGWLFAAAGVGTGLGPIVARRITGDDEHKQRRALILSYVITSLGLVLTATLANFGIVLLGAFIRSFGAGINWVFSTQLLLELAPDQVRGRIFSTEFALFTLANAVGTAAAGSALDHTSLGIAGMVWLSAALVILPGVLWALWLFVARSNRLQPGNKG